jgi:hypothetical protein
MTPSSRSFIATVPPGAAPGTVFNVALTPALAPPVACMISATALYDSPEARDDLLAFKAGDTITISADHGDWLTGNLNGAGSFHGYQTNDIRFTFVSWISSRHGAQELCANDRSERDR